MILNMSAPDGKSVNDGIDAAEFPTVMSSTARWVEVLNKAGRGCLMTKADWADAYKHIRVRAADRVLQWFSWLGMFFVELCLVFGTASSPGLYDRFAKVVLDLALAVSKFPRDMVCQYLDDVCAAAPAGSSALERFRQLTSRWRPSWGCGWRQRTTRIRHLLLLPQAQCLGCGMILWLGLGRSRRTSWGG